MVSGDAVDEASTAARRAAVRAERMRWPVAQTLADAPPNDAAGETVARLGDAASYRRIGGKVYFRCDCGAAFAPGSENWKPYARRASASAAELGPRITLHAELDAARYACPSCARLLDVEIGLKGEAPLFDVEIG